MIANINKSLANGDIPVKREPNMDNTTSVGEQIKKARQAANLTQAELGEKVGFSAMGLSYLENGQRKAKIEDLKKIADALKISITYLLEPVAKIPVTYGVTYGRTSSESDQREKEFDESIKKFDEFVAAIEKGPGQ